MVDLCRNIRDSVPVPSIPSGHVLVPGVPSSQRLFDGTLVIWGRWYRNRHAPGQTGA